jgi:PmbA protein
MKNDARDLGAWALETAKSAGAGDCRILLESERLVEISYRDRKPENIKEASTLGLSIEVFVDGRYSQQHTSDLRRGALKTFIENAVASTRLLAEDPYRTLPDPKYYKGRQTVDLGLVDPSYKDLTPEARHGFVRALEESALTRGGNKVVSVEARTNDSYVEYLVLASNGLEADHRITYYLGAASMTAKDEGDRRPQESAYAVTVDRKSMPAPEALGAEAARRTLSLLGGKKIKTETLPVVIENRVVARFGGGFLQAMFGRSIQQKQSFLADKKGQAVASPVMTLIDNPLLPGGLGSRLIDQDGMSTRKRTMIEAGVLKDFYVDWYYSRKLGWEPTTGQPSNLIIPPGRRSVDEIMKDLGRGIFVTGFIGGNSNSTTGDTSIGIVGQLFEKGVPVQAVSEMNIADNHLKLWPKLIEAANDPYPYSSQRFPSLVFKDIVVSGI